MHRRRGIGGPYVSRAAIHLCVFHTGLLFPVVLSWDFVDVPLDLRKTGMKSIPFLPVRDGI